MTMRLTYEKTFGKHRHIQPCFAADLAGGWQTSRHECGENPAGSGLWQRLSIIAVGKPVWRKGPRI